MDQLLGALGHELEAYEAEEGSDTDDGAVSGTDQGIAHCMCHNTLFPNTQIPKCLTVHC